MTRKTKIIATVGPSIHSKEAINEIIDAGANVLRLNFSHGSNDEYKQIVDWARSVSYTHLTLPTIAKV